MHGADGSDWIDDNERIRLVDNASVFLLRSKMTGRDNLENRLADAFRAAWGMLQLIALQTILRYWHLQSKLPERIVINDLDFDRCGNPIVAEAKQAGNRIEFDERAVRFLPDALLIGAIHHELAHVYANAIGDLWHRVIAENQDPSTIEKALIKAEGVVKELLNAWGIPDREEETTHWIATNPTGWAKSKVPD